MALETATYISGLDAANPLATDPKSQGDDHLRLVKSTVKATFPNINGAVTPSHTELNYVDGVTSALQDQLDAKASLTAPKITGLKGTKVAMSANAIDLATGNIFTKAIAADTTLSLSNTPTTGTFIAFVLELTNAGSHTITWWSGVKWEQGAAPVLTASGRDVLQFYTHDGGSNWNGAVFGKDMA